MPSLIYTVLLLGGIFVVSKLALSQTVLSHSAHAGFAPMTVDKLLELKLLVYTHDFSAWTDPS